MVIRSRENSLAAWSFLIGVILAVIIGITTSTLLPIPFITKYISLIYLILVILGLIIGFVNVADRDMQTFLIAGAILVLISNLGINSLNKSLIGIGGGDVFSSIFGALVTLFVPATIVAALKTVFSIARI